MIDGIEVVRKRGLFTVIWLKAAKYCQTIINDHIVSNDRWD